MADFPLLGGQRLLGGVVSGSQGTSATANASAHTKGTYVNLLTAANNVQSSQGLFLMLHSTSADVDIMVDIALGGAGTEVVIASNLFLSNPKIGAPVGYMLPIHIPAGVAVRARCQASTGSTVVRMTATFMAQGFLPSQPLARVDSYGFNTATTRATSVDPGGSLNTKGAWSQITSGTPADHSIVIPVFGIQQNTATTVANWLVDIGFGAAGNEVVVIDNLWCRVFQITASTDAMFGPVAYLPFPLQVPSGTAISARAQCSINDATDRLLDVGLYGIG